MQLPGEGLIGKFWETLADKGIGSLLKPWQIRREGRAQLDVRRQELLALAQTERDAEAIRRGEASLGDDFRTIERIVQSEVKLIPGLAPELNANPLQAPLLIAQRSHAADSLIREVHIAKAALHAEAELASDASTEPSVESPSDDWLYRWKDYAASVSSDELQALWGRVLAGEVRKPGQYSVRFMNFLHNISREEAQLIEKAMPFVVDGMIYREATLLLERAGLPFSQLLILQELGVLSGAEATGLARTYRGDGKTGLNSLLSSNGYAIGLRHSDPGVNLELPAFIVTSLGQQLASLGRFPANLEYLKLIGNLIKGKGFEVSIGRPFLNSNGMFQLASAETL